MTEDQLETQKHPELEAPPGGALPRRRSTRVRSDEDARCVIELLGQVAARVPHDPATRPPAEGMVRLGNRDRASYVWFLPCPEGTVDSRGGVIEMCNHGLGVDRAFGAYEVRAWAHGSPGVHDLTLHAGQVTLELLETAARLVGLPLTEPYVGALEAECPVCLTPDVRHDGLQLETHKTPAGHQCHGSGWKITRSRG
jgi:hypothetical protein